MAITSPTVFVFVSLVVAVTEVTVGPLVSIVI